MQLTAQKCKLDGKNNKFVEDFDNLDRLSSPTIKTRSPFDYT